MPILIGNILFLRKKVKVDVLLINHKVYKSSFEIYLSKQSK